MLSWFVAVLLLIDLGPAFQNASAFGEPAPNDMLFVDVQVEIAGEVQAAFAHVIDPGDEQLTVALINRGGSFWGGGAEIERANLVVVFEAIRPDGSSVQSEATDLISMGVDAALFGPTTPVVTVAEEEPGAGFPNWAWLIVAGVAALLSVLAFRAMRDFPSAPMEEEAEASPPQT